MTLSDWAEQERRFEEKQRIRYDLSKQFALEWFRAQKLDFEKRRISKEEGEQFFREVFLREYNKRYNLSLQKPTLEETKNFLLEHYQDNSRIGVVMKRDIIAGLVKRISEEEKLDYLFIGSSGMFFCTFKEKKDAVYLEDEKRTYWVEIRKRTEDSSLQLATIFYSETSSGPGHFTLDTYFDFSQAELFKKRLGISFSESKPLEASQKTASILPLSASPQEKKSWWKFWKYWQRQVYKI